MKKENRKLAQEKRAKARKKQEQKAKIKKICMIGLPVLAAIVIIILIVVNPLENSK